MATNRPLIYVNNPVTPPISSGIIWDKRRRILGAYRYLAAIFEIIRIDGHHQ
jgi:hypothetical protein